ncbi:FecR family protein [Membranihabitans maritimus]|uniref:FecR family protein n=1 Tax=Membranihabitans maritimus TaxID=2904244 RepID=UPI001F451E33|nr:FecR domain-containing protein [Membranihabitans maritimus]
MKSKIDIETIYRKYLNKTASKEEIEWLLDWMYKNNNSDILLKEMERNWDASNSSFKGSWKEIEQQLAIAERKASPRKVRYLKFVKYAAAAIIIPLIATLGIWWLTSQQDIYYSTEYGETQSIELPDGSQIILNANSEISWSGNWEKTGSRKVTLNGEAFFDVVQISDTEKVKIPFDVITEDITIKVLGTSFNVSNRSEETNVYLESGKVELDFKDLTLENEEMVPGESINYSKINGNVSRHNSTLVESASWKDGSLIYKQEPLSRVLRDIKNNYGKKIEVNDSTLLNKKVTVGLPYTNWEMVVESLELMLDLNIQKTKDGIILQ